MSKIKSALEAFEKSCSHWVLMPDSKEHYDTIVTTLNQARHAKVNDAVFHIDPTLLAMDIYKPSGLIKEPVFTLTSDELKSGWKFWHPEPYKHCPLPDDTKVYLKFKSGREDTVTNPQEYAWSNQPGIDWIMAYKIVDKKPTVSDGWITHDGNINKKCPVPKDTPIDIILRHGTEYTWESDEGDVRQYAYDFGPSVHMLWSHNTDIDGYTGHRLDIVAYRLADVKPKLEDGWIAWDGKGKSAAVMPGCIVEVKRRDGSLYTAKAESLGWRWSDQAFSDFNIMAYRKKMDALLKGVWIHNDGKSKECPLPAGTKFRIWWGDGGEDPYLCIAPKWNWGHSGNPGRGDIAKYMIVEEAEPKADPEGWIELDLSKCQPREDGSKYKDGSVYVIPPGFKGTDPIEVKFETGKTEKQARCQFYIYDWSQFQRPEGRITHYRKVKS